MDSAIAFFSGLGLFLTATKLLAGLPTQMDVTRARGLIAQATRQPWRAGLAGSIAGLALQSTNAVTLILAHFVGARLIEPVGAMRLVAWANVGSSLLVFLASLKLKPLAMVLVGTCGTIFYYTRGASRTVDLTLRAGLYIGIMLFALTVMRESAGALQDVPGVKNIVASSHSSVSIALLVGLVAALITQSSSTTTILALTAVQARIMGLGDGLMVTLGASAASGLSILLLGAAAGKRERQLVIFQALAKAVGVIVVLPPLLVDRWHPYVELERGLRSIISDPGTEIAVVFLSCQVASLSVFLCAERRIVAMSRLPTSVILEEGNAVEQPNDGVSSGPLARKLSL